MSRATASDRLGVLLAPALFCACALLAIAGLARVLAGELHASGVHAGTVAGMAAAQRRPGSGVLPAAARAPVSAALGAADPRYRISETGAGALGVNPAQGLRVKFGSTFVRVASTRAELTLSLHALGFGARLHAPAAGSPRAHANRVSYQRGPISEWWLNGPLGIEQGFTVTRGARARGAGSLLTIALSLSSSAGTSLSRHDDRVTLGGPGAGARVSYEDLRATDASGKLLPSWLTLSGRTLSLHVQTVHARFPVSVDPILTGEPGEVRLEANSSEAGKGAAFGTSVAISGDGDTALIGAPAGESSPGAAWVFVREGGSWVQQGPKLTPHSGSGSGPCESSGEACKFGQSVALSGNGDTALIGDPPVHHGTGTAWIFTRSGAPAAWAPATQLQDPASQSTQGFGESVALAEDGGTALVGAPAARTKTGVAWIFHGEGASWKAQESPLEVSSLAPDSHLAESVALSANGEEAVLGAPEAGTRAGAAYVFQYEDSAWTQQRLSPSEEGIEGYFGASVALAADGQTVLVGGPRDSNRAGAAWVFVSSGGSFAQQGAKLTGAREGKPAEEYEEFGSAVALSGDGETAAIGASRQHKGLGRVWVFTRTELGWGSDPEEIKDEAEENKGGHFGAAVAIAAGGETVMVGAPHDPEENEQRGNAWLFGARPEVFKLNPEKGSYKGGKEVIIEGENFTEEGAAVRFGTIPAESFKVVSPNVIDAIAPAENLAPGEKLTVEVTVERQGWLSATPDTSDEFTYTRPSESEEKEREKEREKENEKEKESGGGSGGHGGGGGCGSSKKNLCEGPASDYTGIQLPSKKHGSGAVLGSSSHRSCALRLKSGRLAVGSRARAEVVLLASGSGRCEGKLTLRAEVKLASRHRTVSLGTAAYSLLAGHRERVLIALDASARTLLAAHHGRLSATLLLARRSPLPARVSGVSVTLARTT